MRTMLSPERADRYKAKVLNSKVFSSYNGTYHLITCFGSPLLAVGEIRIRLKNRLMKLKA